VAAVVTVLAVSCSEEDSDDTSMTPPTQEQLAGAWRVTRETSNLSFTMTGTEAEFGAALLDITSQYIVAYTPGDTDTCFCPVPMAYRLSGSAIVITDPVADAMLRQMFGDYTMTWANAGADLRLTLTGTMIGGDELPPGTRYSMTMNYTPYTGPFPPPSCADCAVGIAKAGAAGSQAEAAGLVGRWALTGTVVTASGTTNSDTSYSDVTQIYDFRTDTAGPEYVYVYGYDIAENPACYTTDVSEYALQGSALTGDAFAGSESTDSTQYTYSTTAGMSGDMLVLSTRVNTSENTATTDMQAVGTRTLYLARYDGPVPPAEWPQSPCAVLVKSQGAAGAMPLLRLPRAVPVLGLRR